MMNGMKNNKILLIVKIVNKNKPRYRIINLMKNIMKQEFQKKHRN